MLRLRSVGLWISIGALVGACGGGESTPDAGPRIDAYIAAGQVHVSWTVNGASGQAACDSVGASTVTVETSSTSTTTGDSSVFSCSSGMGTSDNLPPGDYRVRVLLESPEIGASPLAMVMAATVTVADRQVAEAGAVDFVVSTEGTVQMFLDANAPGLNCDPETAMPLGGAGITSMALELRDEAGTCVPAQLTVADGAMSGTTGGTFALACPGPTALPCLENDQLVSSEPLPAGEYHLDIVGLEGAEPCYPHLNTTFDIYGGGSVTDLETILLALDQANTNCVAP